MKTQNFGINQLLTLDKNVDKNLMNFHEMRKH